MNKTNRRKFIKAGVVGGAMTVFAPTAFAEKPTPNEIKGPFYPLVPQKDQDFDLTQVADNKEAAKGDKVIIEGQVLDTEGNAIEGATVDIWQANAAGKYRHPHDQSSAPLDPNFQGWAIVQSGKEGGFRFKTVIPGAYPVSDSWLRPPHIHFKVTKAGYFEIITQMYFPDHELNDIDGLLQRKTEEEQLQMIAKALTDKPNVLTYNIVLKKV